MRYGDFHHGIGWVHVLAWLLPFLFIGALVALAVVLLTRDHRPGLQAVRVDDGAHAALRLRYARGEITRDEYYETLRDLSHPAGPAPAPWTPPAAPTPSGPPAPPTPPTPPETPPES
ncbi:MAG TPA: hypothetical protein VIB48_24170 [Acidimicrobiia bacterium]|jgi:hypothetical protein